MLRSYKLERRNANGIAFELADQLEQGQFFVLVVGALKFIESAQVENQVVVQGFGRIAVYSLSQQPYGLLQSTHVE